MTAVEFLIAVAVVLAAAFLAAGWAEAIRSEAKQSMARGILAALDRALGEYHQATGFYPAAREDDPASVVEVLRTVPAARAVLSESLRGSAERGHDSTRPASSGMRATAGADFLACTVDPWGTPLRYLWDSGRHVEVRANAGRPVFLSAGPDRDFGDVVAANLGDNLRSDDPRGHVTAAATTMGGALGPGSDPAPEEGTDPVVVDSGINAKDDGPSRNDPPGVINDAQTNDRPD